MINFIVFKRHYGAREKAIKREDDFYVILYTIYGPMLKRLGRYNACNGSSRLGLTFLMRIDVQYDEHPGILRCYVVA